MIAAPGKELVATFGGLGQRAVADDGYVETGFAIGIEMGEGNAAGADERDTRRIGPRPGRAIGEVGGRDQPGFGGL